MSETVVADMHEQGLPVLPEFVRHKSFNRTNRTVDRLYNLRISPRVSAIFWLICGASYTLDLEICSEHIDGTEEDALLAAMKDVQAKCEYAATVLRDMIARREGNGQIK